LKPDEKAIVLCDIGIALIGLGHRQDALAHFNASIQTWETALAWSEMAAFYDAEGDSERSMGCWSKVIALDPLHVKARLELGYHSIHTQAFEEAGRHFRRVLEIDGSYISALEGAATAIMLSGMHGQGGSASQAMAYLEKADLLKPGDKDILAKKAMLYLVLRDPQKAVACFDSAVAADPLDERIRALRDSYLGGDDVAAEKSGVHPEPVHDEARTEALTFEIPISAMGQISNEEIEACVNSVRRFIDVSLNGLPVNVDLVREHFGGQQRFLVLQLLESMIVGLGPAQSDEATRRVTRVLTGLRKIMLDIQNH
jgi:tetratricopeptide (TPR) repeat protein